MSIVIQFLWNNEWETCWSEFFRYESSYLSAYVKFYVLVIRVGLLSKFEIFGVCSHDFRPGNLTARSGLPAVARIHFRQNVIPVGI